MKVAIANAPVSWGVDYTSDPKNPPWPRVMDEIRAAGYTHTELGPYGYYPTDPIALKQQFDRRGLTVDAGFVFRLLHDELKRAETLDVASKTINLLSAIGGEYLVVIDHISQDRVATAGRRDLAPKLDAPRFEYMVSLIDRIADLALAKGITPMIHQHAGCYIEFEDELEAVLDRLDPKRVGICIDTGHMSYAGIDPVAFYESHSSRVRHFHFKDIDRSVHERALKDRIPFLVAVEQRVFCPLDKGVVRWPALVKALEAHGYEGAVTVEQDIDPTISKNPIEDARASLAYLRSVGF